MKKPILQTALFFSIMAGSFILVDLALDRILGGASMLTWPHLILAIVVVFTSFFLLNRALQERKRAEVALKQARDELEIRVNKRTAELERINASLQVEIAERKQAEQAREQSLVEVEQARQRAEDLAGELQQVNNRLRSSEETARALMDASFESAMLIDTQGVILAANAIAAWRFATTVEQMVGSSMFDFLPPEAAKRRRSYLNQVLEMSQPASFIDERDERFYDIYIYPICDESGKIIRLAVFGQDITERKQAELALRESEERYRTMFDNFSEPTTAWNRNGVLLMENLISARNLGGKREDYLGKTIYDIFGPAADAYMERMARVIDTGVTEYQEDVVELHFGNRYFWTCMQRIQNPDGQHAVQIISYDITERKRVEDALRVSEEKFSTVYHFSPEAIGIVRVADGIFLDVNESFTKMLGYARSEVVGRNWTELSLFPAAGEVNRLVELFREKGKVVDFELDFTTREEQVVVMLVSLIPIRVGGEACIMAIAHDISERKQSEQAFRQMQAELARGNMERTAMEERQRLARELHDSVSQALYGISLGTHTALTLIDTDRSVVLEALNYILSLAQTGLTEMRALIFELRPESLEMEGLVGALTKQTAALRVRHGLEIELGLGDEPDAPLPVKEAFYRIAQEALQNAVKHSRANRLEVRLAREQDHIILEVCDNGVGFDPLAAYPGHLGLRSMRERAQSLGGTLDIVSAPASGAQIRASIPIPVAQAV